MRTTDNTAERTIRATICVGRFTGPTVEHEKLFDRFMSIEDDYKFMYIFGPWSRDKLTDRDPLLLSEKRYMFSKVLDDNVLQHAIFGDHQYTSSLFQALVNVYQRTKREGYSIHLNVVGGEGDAGISGKDKGASADEYVDILGRANHSRYPTGEMRMSFDTVDYHRQPRGEISGTVLRQAARSYNYTSEQDVEEFRQMLHSGFDASLARGLIKIIQERTSGDNKPT